MPQPVFCPSSLCPRGVTLAPAFTARRLAARRSWGLDPRARGSDARAGAGLGVWVPRVRGKGAGISAGVLNYHTVEVDSTLRIPICPSPLGPFFATQPTQPQP